MEPEQVAGIMKSLTKAQRAAVLSGRTPSGAGKWPLQNALIGKGLARYWPFEWTSLGRAVRAHLIEGAKDDGE